MIEGNKIVQNCYDLYLNRLLPLNSILEPIDSVEGNLVKIGLFELLQYRQSSMQSQWIFPIYLLELDLTFQLLDAHHALRYLLVLLVPVQLVTAFEQFKTSGDPFLPISQIKLAQQFAVEILILCVVNTLPERRGSPLVVLDRLELNSRRHFFLLF